MHRPCRAAPRAPGMAPNAHGATFRLSVRSIMPILVCTFPHPYAFLFRVPETFSPWLIFLRTPSPSCQLPLPPFFASRHFPVACLYFLLRASCSRNFLENGRSADSAIRLPGHDVLRPPGSQYLSGPVARSHWLLSRTAGHDHPECPARHFLPPLFFALLASFPPLFLWPPMDPPYSFSPFPPSLRRVWACAAHPSAEGVCPPERHPQPLQLLSQLPLHAGPPALDESAGGSPFILWRPSSSICSCLTSSIIFFTFFRPHDLWRLRPRAAWVLASCRRPPARLTVPTGWPSGPRPRRCACLQGHRSFRPDLSYGCTGAGGDGRPWVGRDGWRWDGPPE